MSILVLGATQGYPSLDGRTYWVLGDDAMIAMRHACGFATFGVGTYV